MTAANTLTSLRKVHYSKNIEINLHDTLIMNDLAFDRSDEFPDGITFEVPQLAYMATGNYAGTLASKGVTSQKSTLTMDKIPIVTWTYDDVDKLKDSWDVLARVDTNSVYKLKQTMEGDFFSLYSSARYGNATPSAVLTTSTAYSAVTTLIHAGVPPDQVCVVGDAFLADILAQQAISSTFALSDQSFQRGYVGVLQSISGARLYRNQNLSTTYTLDLATNPSNGDTVTINTIVYTFVTTIGTTAGNILIGASADASCQNLVEAINADATGVAGANVGVKYVAHTQDDADFVTGFTATDGTNLMTMVSKHGYRVVSSNMTNASNDWAAVYTHAIVMGTGAISVAYRRAIQTDKRSISTSLEYVYSNYLLWGQVVTVEGAKKMYNLTIMSQAAEA
jgi:hypothetical protein